ncbi:MAG: hypothetical protein K0S75_2951 [Clostridia bacterium]|nr:hypothetical protein [Clostridia bacterium]
MTMLAPFGVIYIVVKILGRLELTTAFSSFKSALYTLKPCGRFSCLYVFLYYFSTAQK